MNANQIADAETAYFDGIERRHYAKVDADEDRAEAIEERAAAIYLELVTGSDGHVTKDAMDEAIGDLCIRPETMARLAKCKDDSKPELAGQIILEWFDTYWDKRCRELAEDQIEAEEQRAKEDAEADRYWYGEN